MRLITSIVCLLLSSGLNADENAKPPLIKPANVAKHLKQKCIVEMEVKSTGKSSDGKLIFLNSEENFRDKENFGIVIDLAVAEKLKEAKINDPYGYYLNKKVRVTGTITLYKERPQIRLDAADQIQVVGNK